ncbi:phage regulatory CII family protein [Vibrio cincinnatiensis]|uniref:phage regulatory CII family protein n=1 Tax=Vibrio cincinnatiensis TaxID=675 RepID=UPI001302CA50|nr:phage regulatory CII family protein [Vibrio cincinnatiensis]
MHTAIVPPTCVFPQVVHALYQTLKEHGNTEAVEQHLNKRPGVLFNEINPNQTSHKLGLFDAIRLMQFTDGVQILRSIASELNHSIYFLGDYRTISDMELLNCYSRWHAEIGDVNRAIADALEDGDIEPKEFERIEREIQETFSAALELLERLRALVNG